MFEPVEREEIRQSVRVQWVAWWLMAASVVIYVGVAHLLEADWHGAAPVEPEVLRYIRLLLQAVTVVILVATPYMRRRILGKPVFPQGQEAVSRPGSAGPVTQSARRHVTAQIVSVALSEQIGLFGLVLFVLGDSFRTLYLFAAVSIISMIAYLPRAGAIEALAVELKRRMG
jgi:hypothetical protein